MFLVVEMFLGCGLWGCGYGGWDCAGCGVVGLSRCLYYI